jgi:hypothetical protein
MMTLSRGIRGGAGGFPRAVARLVAAVLAVTAMLAAMWAGPPASASVGTQPRAASPPPSPAPVKFYIVPPPGDGPAESLFTIAAKTLGDGSRFMEIFNLNKGRLQPNGGRLTNPQLIEPGWILQLPANAAGPGVHFGPLPVVTAPAPHRPSRPAGTGSAAIISGAVLAFLTAGLAFRLIRRRAGPTRRRRPAHARAPGRAGRPSRRAVAQSGSPPAGRGPPAVPATGTQRWAAPLDNTPGPAPPECHAAGRPQVAATGSPAGDRERATFERDATVLRPALMDMRAELDWVAARAAGTLQSTTTPMTAPAARPTARQTTKPTTPPAIPLSQPDEPATRPAKPAAKPAGPPRQVRAVRLAVLAMTVPILFGLITAGGELALHGYGFFVFRSAGTGATQQGPSGPALSQPPAAHHLHRTGSGQAGPRGARHPQDREGHEP